MDFAHHRQLFLTEQGYSYEILDESELAQRLRVCTDHADFAASNVLPPQSR